MIIINEYKPILVDNNQYFINKKTGEAVAAITVTAPIGTKFFTPEQQNKYKEYQLSRLKKQTCKKQTSELGNFYFVLSNFDIFDGLTAEVTTRLIFLLTYLNYHGDLQKTNRSRMKKNDLCSLLGVSESSVFRFWKEVNGKFIVEDSDGYLKLTSDDLFRKGKLKICDENKHYQRFYINSIRNLYRQTPPSKHKHLGYVYKMLPFINIEYNVLCTNPFETNEKEVKPISLNEFCHKISYETKNRQRLMKMYSLIKFDVKDNKQLFCSFVSDGTDIDNMRIFVNPHVIYGGSDFKKVEVLGIFCR